MYLSHFALNKNLNIDNVHPQNPAIAQQARKEAKTIYMFESVLSHNAQCTIAPQKWYVSTRHGLLRPALSLYLCDESTLDSL
eukprot:scaffold266768_cov36-Prasinocladus_malaysianus.AAC.1